MAEVATLPIAQPAARPEPAAASKTASTNTETTTSFADVLETETGETTDTAKAISDMTAAEQPVAPPPVVSPVVAATVAVQLALATGAIAPEGGEVDSTGFALTPAPAVNTTMPADPALALAAAQSAETVSTPATPSPIASAAPAAEPVAAAAANVAPKSAKLAPPETNTGETPAPEADSAIVSATAVASNSEAAPATTAAPAIASATGIAAAEAIIAVIDPARPAAAVTKPAAVAATAEAAPAAPAVPAAPIEADQADATVTQSSAPGAERAKAATNANASPPSQGSTANTSQAAQATSGADVARQDVKADVAAPSTITSSATPDMATAMRAPAGDAARTQATHPALQQAPAAAIQVYTRMIERFDGRAQRFEVRLDPAELGRVDVRIEIGADKKVHAVLAAHDSAALTDLMRGQRSLERALADAGFDLADGGIKFEMSGDNGRSLNGNQQRNGAWGSPEDAYVWRGFNSVDVPVETNAADLAQATRSYTRRSARLDLVA